DKGRKRWARPTRRTEGKRSGRRGGRGRVEQPEGHAGQEQRVTRKRREQTSGRQAPRRSRPRRGRQESLHDGSLPVSLLGGLRERVEDVGHPYCRTPLREGAFAPGAVATRRTSVSSPAMPSGISDSTCWKTATLRLSSSS